MTWDDVVAIGVALPSVEVGTAYGTPTMRVQGKFIAPRAVRLDDE